MHHLPGDIAIKSTSLSSSKEFGQDHHFCLLLNKSYDKCLHPVSMPKKTEVPYWSTLGEGLAGSAACSALELPPLQLCKLIIHVISL